MFAEDSDFAHVLRRCGMREYTVNGFRTANNG